MEDARFLARPSKDQYEWQDMELGMFVHWYPEIRLPDENDPANPPGIKSSDHTSHAYEGYRAERVAGVGAWDLEAQKRAASYIHCPDYDPDQWVQSAVELGAKYIVFVAKHCSGICRWRSEYGGLNFNYATSFRDGKGDPLAELAEACRKRGIKLGIYLNARDIPHGTADRGIADTPEHQKAYNEIYSGWLTEVLSKYGEICEVWFDGSNNLDVGNVLKKYAPHAMVFNSRYGTVRWVGNEEGYATDPAWCSVSHLDMAGGTATLAQGDPDADSWAPYECDTTIRDEWGYNHAPKNRLRTLDELMNMYYNTVGKGTNLLINHAPNNLGRIDAEDMARMKEFGDEIRRRFSHPVAETSGEGEIVELDLGGRKKIDHVVSMEEIAYGHRVRFYFIEGFDGEKWIYLASGISLGHKRIDYFEATELEKVRIRVPKHVGTPLIRSLAAYYAGVTPKLRPREEREVFRVGEYGASTMDWDKRTVELDIDLAPYITVAGQFRLEFRDADDAYYEVAQFPIEHIELEWGGYPAPEYLKPTDDEKVFRIFAPGGTDSCRLRVHSGKLASTDIKGSVLLSRED